MSADEVNADNAEGQAPEVTSAEATEAAAAPSSASGPKPNYTPPVRPAGSAATGYQQQATPEAGPAAGSEMSAEKAIGLAFLGGFVAARVIRKIRG